jgi:hypothetical protein
MLRVEFDVFAVDVPRGWTDVTGTVKADNPPFTLARGDGVGALQFSIALYKGGPAPDSSPSDLGVMVERFRRESGLGEPAALVTEPGPPLLAAGSFAWGDNFLRVWQVSDGRNFAFITYTCAVGEAGPELPACERIVRSIVFREGSRGGVDHDASAGRPRD